jgi:hypothetical protein
MKAESVIRALFDRLPKYTDKFTDTIQLSSITSTGLVATVTTAIDHGLTTGSYVHISGALVPNSITSLTQVDGIANAVTALNNDITSAVYQPTIKIVGADDEKYNGTHNLICSINRNEFVFEVDDSAVSPDTGAPFLLEDLKYASYNGWHEITVLNSTQFTYALQRELGSPAAGDIKLQVNPRITGAGSEDEAFLSYTAQGQDKLWAYVVVDDLSASKERSESSDATMRQSNMIEYRQMVVHPFHVYIFFTNIDNISTRKVRDDVIDLLFPFCKSLLRLRFPSGFTEDPYSGVVFSGSLFERKEQSAIYVNDLLFETTAEIQYKDTIDDDTSVAFRDIDTKYKTSLSDDDLIKMQGNINLDNYPE